MPTQIGKRKINYGYNPQGNYVPTALLGEDKSTSEDSFQSDPPTVPHYDAKNKRYDHRWNHNPWKNQ